MSLCHNTAFVKFFVHEFQGLYLIGGSSVIRVDYTLKLEKFIYNYVPASYALQTCIEFVIKLAVLVHFMNV